MRRRMLATTMVAVTLLAGACGGGGEDEAVVVDPEQVEDDRGDGVDREESTPTDDAHCEDAIEVLEETLTAGFTGDFTGARQTSAGGLAARWMYWGIVSAIDSLPADQAPVRESVEIDTSALEVVAAPGACASVGTFTMASDGAAPGVGQDVVWVEEDGQLKVVDYTVATNTLSVGESYVEGDGTAVSLDGLTVWFEAANAVATDEVAGVYWAFSVENETGLDMEVMDSRYTGLDGTTSFVGTGQIDPLPTGELRALMLGIEDDEAPIGGGAVEIDLLDTDGTTWTVVVDVPPFHDADGEPVPAGATVRRT